MNRRKRIRLFQLLLGALLYLLSFHAAELAEESLEVTQIVLDSDIKTFGTFEIEVKIYPQVTAKIKVSVVE